MILLTPDKSRPYEKRETSVHLKVHKETRKNKLAFEGLRHGVQGRESTHVHKAPPLTGCRAPRGRGAQAATRPVGNTSAEPGTRPILPAPVLRRNFQSTQGVFGRNLSIRFGAFCFEDCSIFFTCGLSTIVSLYWYQIEALDSPLLVADRGDSRRL